MYFFAFQLRLRPKCHPNANPATLHRYCVENAAPNLFPCGSGNPKQPSLICLQSAAHWAHLPCHPQRCWASERGNTKNRSLPSPSWGPKCIPVTCWGVSYRQGMASASPQRIPSYWSGLVGLSFNLVMKHSILQRLGQGTDSSTMANTKAAIAESCKYTMPKSWLVQYEGTMGL